MTKAISISLFLAYVSPLFSQPNRPEFEAASIKASKANEGHSSWHSRPGYLVMNNQTLKALAGIAYGVPTDRVLGGPKWIESDRYDIVARAAEPADGPKLLLMLQSTLAERFQLAVHRETKSVAGFALVPAKNGLKIRPDETGGGERSNSSRGKLVVERISLETLAKSLTRIMGVPVADATDIKGMFTFTLEWSPESTLPTAGTDGALPDAPGPSLFTVLQQQLGLKLESKRVSTEVVVIDKAERPSEN